MARHAKLAQVVVAGGAGSCGADGLHGRHQQTDENAEDRNHDEHFDQGVPAHSRTGAGRGSEGLHHLCTSGAGDTSLPSQNVMLPILPSRSAATNMPSGLKATLVTAAPTTNVSSSCSLTGSQILMVPS